MGAQWELALDGLLLLALAHWELFDATLAGGWLNGSLFLAQWEFCAVPCGCCLASSLPPKNFARASAGA
jgi:hypothetical protein